MEGHAPSCPQKGADTAAPSINKNALRAKFSRIYLRGVELIGPARVGPYNNLVPIFGALLGVGLIGESFAFYHAAGLVLTLSGIGLCERKGNYRAPAFCGRMKY